MDTVLPTFEDIHLSSKKDGQDFAVRVLLPLWNLREFVSTVSSNSRRFRAVVRRRLAAILIADVVGYSRLVEAEEAWTLATLKTRRKEIFEPLVREYGGRIVRFMGDGALVEFPSAVNAVLAGNEIQKKMEAVNKSLPTDRHVILRIGINLGDVIGDGSDIYGEGINIAARLEPLSDAGGMCISQKVHDEVHGKVDVAFDDMGELQLKNISVPVRVYSTRSASGVRRSPSAPRQDTPSIAVLPFVNLSNDPNQQYFSDGITQDIITELSRFRQLKVIARNSSFQFRGTSLDMISVGRALGVSYLVEGSVRRIGSHIRITAQLIEAMSAHHVWAEKYDRDQEEIFSIQDEVVHTIVATLMGRLRTAVVEGSKRKPPSSLAAYECVLRAEALPYGDIEIELEARRLLEKAITIDPNYGQAYALLANSYRLEWRRDMSGSDNLLAQALALAERSVALDGKDDECHVILGLVLLHRRAYELAEYHFRKALDLNQNRASPLTSLGWLYAYLGSPTEALSYIRKARSLDPLYEPSWYWRMMGFVSFVARRHEETIGFFRKAPSIPFWAHGFLAACYAHLDRMGDARYHATEALRSAADFSIRQIVAKEPFQRESDTRHLVDGMRKAGLPE